MLIRLEGVAIYLVSLGSLAMSFVSHQPSFRKLERPDRRSCQAASGSMSTMPEIGGVDKTIKDLTLVFCRRTITDSEGDANPICRRDEILLGLKKRGFGEGKWNGFGGKVEAGETVDEAAKRELLEESGVVARELSLRGRLVFKVPSYPSVMRVHVYEAVTYEGTPTESEEMRPQWFNVADLPFKEMWADDEHWMPLFLAGKFFQGEFNFSDEQTIIDFALQEVPASEAVLT